MGNSRLEDLICLLITLKSKEKGMLDILMGVEELSWMNVIGYDFVSWLAFELVILSIDGVTSPMLVYKYVSTG